MTFPSSLGLDANRPYPRPAYRVTERLMPPLNRKAWGKRATGLSPATRLVAIGDIHGRLDLFSILVRAIGSKLSSIPKKKTQLIILGDFIDRGPSSAKVLQALRHANEEFDNCIVLRGNHEESFVAAAHGDREAQLLWLEHGGMAMLESFGIAPPKEGEDSFSFAERLRAAVGIETLEWLMDLPTHYFEPPFFFCHAGVRPGVPLGKQNQQDLMWIRQAFMESGQDHGAIIVHGHNIVSDVEIRANRISLDTGAYASGTLSATILDSEFMIVMQTAEA